MVFVLHDSCDLRPLHNMTPCDKLQDAYYMSMAEGQGTYVVLMLALKLETETRVFLEICTICYCGPCSSAVSRIMQTCSQFLDREYLEPNIVFCMHLRCCLVLSYYVGQAHSVGCGAARHIVPIQEILVAARIV